MRTIASLDHQSRWSVLRRLGNSTIAKATIAVPLVGYLLLFNGEIVKFLSLHTDFAGRPVAARRCGSFCCI